MEYRLPNDFTDKVMNKIEAEIVLQAQKKENRRSTFVIVLYVLAGMVGFAAILYALSVFKIISFADFGKLFDGLFSFETQNIPEAKDFISMAKPLFQSIISAFLSFFAILKQYSLCCIVFMDMIILLALSELLPQKKTH